MCGQGRRRIGRQAPICGQSMGGCVRQAHLKARYEGMWETDPIYGQDMRGCGRKAPSMGKV